MRILVVHNRYALQGGEDSAFEQEAELLEKSGHEVRRWEVTNQGMDSEGRVSVAAECIWSRRQATTMAGMVRMWRPDIVHIHNFVARLSPAIHRAANQQGATVVQTLHNFRLVCLNALLLRAGHSCELCRRRWIKWPGVRYWCYRKSRAASLVLASMLATHRAAGTWKRVHAFITLTSAARKIFIDEGLPEDRLHVKPNFAPDPGILETNITSGFVFIGRLSEEKGVRVLLEAWRQVVTEEPLTVIGDGPLMPHVREAALTDRRIKVEGWVPRQDVCRRLGHHRAVVIPSQCSEMFPLAVVEAYAKGIPVIASRTPALQELVVEGKTGILVDVGNAEQLADAMGRLAEEEESGKRMGRESRRLYEAKYTPKQNYAMIAQVYQSAIEEQRRGHP